MISSEALVPVESIRTPRLREYGSLHQLSRSIYAEGLRRPVTVWSDGTLISGGRRHHAYLSMGRDQISAVFVDTIEDAAKRLLGDNQDDAPARPWKPSEICRLWALMRRLDAPAAKQRADAARRLAVQRRRLTAAGKRPAGREKRNGDDYVLSVLCESFRMSETSAGRLWAIYAISEGIREPEKQDMARKSLQAIDAGESSIWANYRRLREGRTAPVAVPRSAQPTESADTRRQIAAWDRVLPQLEGLTAGLVELGPPNTELTWDQVSPVHTRLAAVRRDLEKIIKQMKGIAQS